MDHYYLIIDRISAAADGVAKADFSKVPIASILLAKITQINIKIDSQRRTRQRTVTVEFGNLDISREEFFSPILNPFSGTKRHPKVVGDTTSVTGHFEDGDDCVPPFDVNCDNPQQAMVLDDPIVGAVFDVKVTLSDFDPADVISGALAIWYDNVVVQAELDPKMTAAKRAKVNHRK